MLWNFSSGANQLRRDGKNDDFFIINRPCVVRQSSDFLSVPMKHKILYSYPLRLFVLVSVAIALLMLLQTQQAWRAIAKLVAFRPNESKQA